MSLATIYLTCALCLLLNIQIFRFQNGISVVKPSLLLLKGASKGTTRSSESSMSSCRCFLMPKLQPRVQSSAAGRSRTSFLPSTTSTASSRLVTLTLVGLRLPQHKMTWLLLRMSLILMLILLLMTQIFKSASFCRIVQQFKFHGYTLEVS